MACTPCFVTCYNFTCDGGSGFFFIVSTETRGYISRQEALDWVKQHNPRVGAPGLFPPLDITAEMLRRENARDWFTIPTDICHTCYEHLATVVPAGSPCKATPPHATLCACCAAKEGAGTGPCPRC
jgi:hypothetical protein